MRPRSLKYITVFISLSLILSSIAIFGGPRDFHAQSLEEELQRIQQEREDMQKQIEEISKTENYYKGEVSKVEEQLLGALSELDDSKQPAVRGKIWNG